jgi:hypothetical protein
MDQELIRQHGIPQHSAERHGQSYIRQVEIFLRRCVNLCIERARHVLTRLTGWATDPQARRRLLLGRAKPAPAPVAPIPMINTTAGYRPTEAAISSRLHPRSFGRITGPVGWVMPISCRCGHKKNVIGIIERIKVPVRHQA